MSTIKHRSPWGVWLLQFTVIYYLVWYVKVNHEMARVHGLTHVGTTGMWLGQCTPIANLIGLAHTSARMSAAEARYGLPPSTSGGMMIVSSWWFGSHVRYLQRRLNRLALELDRQRSEREAAAA
jgi:hypothetical protein